VIVIALREVRTYFISIFSTVDDVTVADSIDADGVYSTRLSNPCSMLAARRSAIGAYPEM
jgi:hypothetical protein